MVRIFRQLHGHQHRLMVEVGDFVEATLLTRRADGVFDAEAVDVPEGWSVQFKPQDPDGWSAGNAGRFRVFRVYRGSRLIHISDSDVGFEPISDSMRPRYLHSIEMVLSSLPIAAAYDRVALLYALSEVQEIFDRCVKQDKSDWFDVYVGLGRPFLRDLRWSAAAIAALNRSLQEGQFMEACSFAQHAIRQFLEEESLLLIELVRGMLYRLRNHIQNTYPRLSDNPSPIRSPKIKSAGDAISNLQPIRSEVNTAALRRANELHETTLTLLFGKLREIGCIPEYNLFIDCFARLKTGPALFEVKSIHNENELSQAREALAQLYEYRYRHNYPQASLWVVFSKPPETDWLLEYLLKDREINVLWAEGEALRGPSVSLLDTNFRRT